MTSAVDQCDIYIFNSPLDRAAAVLELIRTISHLDCSAGIQFEKVYFLRVSSVVGLQVESKR